MCEEAGGCYLVDTVKRRWGISVEYVRVNRAKKNTRLMVAEFVCNSARMRPRACIQRIP